jgi:hypothetical protein
LLTMTPIVCSVLLDVAEPGPCWECGDKHMHLWQITTKPRMQITTRRLMMQMLTLDIAWLKSGNASVKPVREWRQSRIAVVKSWVTRHKFTILVIQKPIVYGYRRQWVAKLFHDVAQLRLAENASYDLELLKDFVIKELAMEKYSHLMAGIDL